MTLSRRGLVRGALAAVPLVACRRDRAPSAAQPPCPIPPARTVVVGGAVLDAEGRAFLPDRVVVVEGQRIAGIEPRATFVARASDVVVDAVGGFVVPGLVDAHVHFLSWALDRARRDLTTCDSLAACLAAVA
ncbi:MAG TPA: hypothetical protein VFG69_01400, partial [Nannocystaceae bacterium]|nr:hypothetical protein [Nannocystaceae bacterium]